MSTPNNTPEALPPVEISSVVAHKVADWFKTRGGLLRWASQDLSNPAARASTPALDSKGAPMQSPHWRYGPTPERHVTDPSQVLVYSPKTVETFPVKLKREGMKIVLSDKSTTKVREALARHGPRAFHTFGATGTAIAHAIQNGEDVVNICVDADTPLPLPEWIAANPEPAPAPATPTDEKQ